MSKKCKKCLIKDVFDPHDTGQAVYCLECRILLKSNKLQGISFTREKARIRDNQTCQDCGKNWKCGERKFDIHHLNGLCGKKSKKYDRISDIDSLITLCHKCHFNRYDHTFSKKNLLTVVYIKTMV